MKCLFSGRFDPPHPGHIASIQKLLHKFEKVVVMMLDYPERRFPLSFCCRVIEKCVCNENMSVQVNKTHFGKLTEKEWNSHNCDIYAGGNLKVLDHIEKLGILVYYIDRSFPYAASKILDIQDE